MLRCLCCPLVVGERCMCRYQIDGKTGNQVVCSLCRRRPSLGREKRRMILSSVQGLFSGVGWPPPQGIGCIAHHEVQFPWLQGIDQMIPLGQAFTSGWPESQSKNSRCNSGGWARERGWRDLESRSAENGRIDELRVVHVSLTARTAVVKARRDPLLTFIVLQIAQTKFPG